MKARVEKPGVNVWYYCILEDDNSLSFEEHNNYAGGVILSKEWKSYGERNKDCTPINYEKDVKELLEKYRKNEPSYYEKIQKMLRDNEKLQSSLGKVHN